MGWNGSYSAAVTLLGSGLGSGGVPILQETGQTRPPGQNLPGPEGFSLVLGTIQLMMPNTSFNFTAVMLQAPAGSTNAKYFCTAAGVPVAGPWTYGSVTIPTGPGSSLYLMSAGSENIMAAYVP